MTNERFALELLKMYREDFKFRDELAKSGELFNGYNEEMEKLHIRNAERLEEIIQEIGWPTIDKVGQEASYAAWIILQHAISKPSLQRKSIPLLMELASKNEILSSEVAILYDRVCYFEMRPQKYGTQFDFNENDELVPWKIEDVDKVDEYRKQMGLPPLNESIERMKKLTKKEGERPPIPYEKRLEKRKKWAKKVGWID